MQKVHAVVADVTARIEKRSALRRRRYLDLLEAHRPQGLVRARAGDSNLAHAAAGCAALDKSHLLGAAWPNIGIVTAYNDMLSAHQPLATYPDIIKQAAREVGAVAQVAGGVPAMCDGVTQGREGMDLSLFSRDVIALATAVSLSHDVFDAIICLGVCDKIVPGLLIGALRFGWLPTIFAPAGPMPSGLSNPEKAKVRQDFAAGVIGREALLAAEAGSYHSPGTCTFYGTANSNQMLMEIMGLHIPGAAFPNPRTPLREALTRAAAKRAVEISVARSYTPIGHVVSERAIVNGIVGLLATGGSTNHTIHLPAIARAAGIEIEWRDFEDLSRVTPLLARVYPNGVADVNHFHAAGGMSFIIRELIDAGLVHADVATVAGPGLEAYAQYPDLDGEALVWRAPRSHSGDEAILRPCAAPFASTGALSVVQGQLGKGIVKLSAVRPEHMAVRAPARIFDSQEALNAAFEAGELNRDVVAVVRFQGPRANGMPELHKLTPALSVLQDKGFRVALVTDGRMSGASGKIPAAIHMIPEAILGGPLARLRDGDIITLNCSAGTLEIDVAPEDFAARAPANAPHPEKSRRGLGRELFAPMRGLAGDAESGASFFADMENPDA